MKPSRVLLYAMFLGSFVFTSSLVRRIQAQTTVIPPPGTVAPKWSLPLPSVATSPAVADMNNDGRPDIVVATNNGHILAIRDNGSSGSKIWDTDIAAFYGVAPGMQRIESSPAVADIDKDGRPEVVVGTGSFTTPTCAPGSVIVLEHNGSLKPGWPKLAADDGIPPANCPDEVYGTPALADLTHDGYLEVTVGGFDKRIYAWRYNGVLLPGFPADSAHAFRFPDWDAFQGHLSDTIWSSPAIADLDGDGFLDIVLGTDEGNLDDRWGGDSGGWVCPYTLPPGWTPGSCGGSLYALDRFGASLPGYPKRVLEIVQSVPALTDIDGDARPEVFVGTGTFYHDNSPDSPTDGFRVFGWDGQGNDLAGWNGGQVTGGSMPASPAIGDIDGDGDPEIVALGMDRFLYAWHHNGALVTGFPMKPKDSIGATHQYNVGSSIVLADYDVDANHDMEMFVVTGWEVAIVNGDGSQITASSRSPYNGPTYSAGGSLRGVPAVGDVDGDNQLELIAASNNLLVWNLPTGSTETDWPMFKQDAARNSYLAQPTLSVVPAAFAHMQEQSNSNDIHMSLRIDNIGPGGFDWTATEPGPISLSPSSGTITDMVTTQGTITRAGLSLGQHNWTIVVDGSVGGRPVAGSPKSIPVTVYIVNQIYQIYLPAVMR